MAKSRTEYLCRECGANHPKWMGKCPDCGAWDSLERFTVEADAAKAGAGPIWGAPVDGGVGPGAGGTDPGDLASQGIGRPLALGEVPEAAVARMPTGIGELDRVLGGGLVPGSVLLLGGDPGIGKSTLLMQLAASVASARGSTPGRAPASRPGGEGASALHAPGLHTPGLHTPGTHVASLHVSSLYVSSEESPQQVRLRAERLEQVVRAGGAQGLGGALQVLGETNVARIVEQARRLRPAVVLVDSIQLIHRADGLAEIESVRTVLAGAAPAPGCAFVATMAGTRCLLGEIHALASTGFLGSAKRRASGLDSARLAMLIAVLEKHGGLRLADQDVFAQALGGLRIVEPAADLALALAVAGAFLGRALPEGTVAIGEIGLTGELRAVPQLEQRVHESLRRGARVVLLPASAKLPARASGGASALESANIVKVGTIQGALELLSPVQRSLAAPAVAPPTVTAGASGGPRRTRSEPPGRA